MAIAKYAKNKGTAVEFAKWWTWRRSRRPTVLVTSQASAVKSLYTDPEIVKKFPFMDACSPRSSPPSHGPKAVKYGDVTLAIQDAAYGALQGQTDSATALSQLQTKLQTLIQ